MSGSLYKPAKAGEWALFKVFPQLTEKGAHVMFTSTQCPRNGQTVTYNGAASLRSQVLTVRNTHDGKMLP